VNPAPIHSSGLIDAGQAVERVNPAPIQEYLFWCGIDPAPIQEYLFWCGIDPAPIQEYLFWCGIDPAPIQEYLFWCGIDKEIRMVENGVNPAPI